MSPISLLEAHIHKRVNGAWSPAVRSLCHVCATVLSSIAFTAFGQPANFTYLM